MKPNYDDEATQYQGENNETTQYEETKAPIEIGNETQSDEAADNEAAAKDEVEVKAVKKDNGWKQAAVGAGSGLLIGGVATTLMGMKAADNPTDPQIKDDDTAKPEWVDDQLQVADDVNDNMSFGEAFAAARAEVGPGGCFVWHGNVYGTYTAAEWNSMTPAQRAEWSDHFSWNHIDHSSSNIAHHSSSAHAGNTTASTGHNQAKTDDGGHVNGKDDDIEVVSVNHSSENHQTNGAQATAHHGPDTNGHTGGNTDVVVVDNNEPEIEVLGVIHDDDNGTNIGALSVDGQEVVLIDVDGNMVFDYMAQDLNGNGEIESNELTDIQDQGITVQDLGGFTVAPNNMADTTGDVDFTTDVYEG